MSHKQCWYFLVSDDLVQMLYLFIEFRAQYRVDITSGRIGLGLLSFLSSDAVDSDRVGKKLSSTFYSPKR
ncbi:hypothetical protein MtrunA17_Chr4g0074451 [Medicago truncatula]|uniref:Uncharacterized protein n=1 Tax=Medicago truncatula TaxID=3880 RepID=A0A396IH76_MEDTR|nr:hypothetical protein MtrunA17_Chr4g0074451 [Medicago truncatula]